MSVTPLNSDNGNGSLFKKVNADLFKWVLFFVIFVVAVYKRFCLPLTPIIDPDIMGYLGPAFNYWENGRFNHCLGRSFTYPLLSLFFSQVFHSLHGIVVFQHIIGLITGSLIFMIFELPLFNKIKVIAGRGFFVLLQLFVSAFFLFGSVIIAFEHTIRPEAIAMFGMVLMVYVIAKLFDWQSSSNGKAVIISLGILLNLALYEFFPRWGLALPVVMIYLLYILWRNKNIWFQRVVCVLAPVLLYFSLLWLPDARLTQQYDSHNEPILDAQFFYSHADIIKGLIQRDVANNDARLMPVSALQMMDTCLDLAYAQDPMITVLPFNPDKLMHDTTRNKIRNNLQLLNPNSPPDSLYAAALKHYDKEVLLLAPVPYTKKVCRQLLFYYTHSLRFAYWLYPWHNNGYRSSKVALENLQIYNNAYYKNYVQEVDNLQGYDHDQHQGIFNVLGYGVQLSFLPVLFLFFVSLILQPYLPDVWEGEDKINLSRLCRFTLFLILVHFGLVLTVAAIHSFDFVRYSESIFPVSIVVYVSCLICLLAIYGSTLRRMIKSIWVKRTLTVMLMFAVVVSVLELAIRNINPPVFRLSVGESYQINLDARRQVVYKNLPSQNDYVPKLDSIIYFSKNKLGFRGPDLPADTHGIARIICIGGSTTECRYLSDGNDWPALLYKKIGAGNHQVWLNNAGLDGHSTFGHLLLLRQHVIDLNPNTAIFLVGINDIGRNDLRDYDLNGAKANAATPLSVKLAKYSKLWAFMLNYKLNYDRSQMAKGQALIHSNIDFSKQGEKQTNGIEAANMLLKHQQYYLPPYKQRILEIIRLCKEHNITPIMITQPLAVGVGIDSLTGKNLATISCTDSLNGEMYWRLLQIYNQELKSTCLEAGVRCIDLANKMPKNTLYYYDYVHFTNQGAEKVAEIIYRDLIGEGK